MKNINLITLLILVFLPVLFAQATEEEPDYEINPPDITDLRLPYYTTISPVYGVRPKEWNIRAIVVSNIMYSWTYIYEFDNQANVISINGKKQLANGKPVTGHLVELYSRVDNQPVWKGRLPVYYWIDPDELSGAITVGTGTFIGNGNWACPVQEVSGGYLLDIGYSYNDDTQQFLNGDCYKAIDKKINGRVYKTYPPSKKIDSSDETYWNVQYFTDPITPLYDIDGKCVLYCDVKQ